MMICVQLDKKEEFDRIWKWTVTYMWLDEGENEGYFAWSCGLDGSKNAYGAAPDGEEFFEVKAVNMTPNTGYDYDRVMQLA